MTQKRRRRGSRAWGWACQRRTELLYIKVIWGVFLLCILKLSICLGRRSTGACRSQKCQIPYRQSWDAQHRPIYQSSSPQYMLWTTESCSSPLKLLYYRLKAWELRKCVGESVLREKEAACKSVGTGSSKTVVLSNLLRAYCLYSSHIQDLDVSWNYHLQSIAKKPKWSHRTAPERPLRDANW